MRVWLASTALLGLILLYLLAISTGNTSRLAEYYWEIFSLTSLLTVGLIGFIGRQLWQIRQKIQAKVFGAKLTLRMVAMFALVAILPGILMFTVSVQFLTKSIESWFDVRVEAGLDRGLSLGRNALDYLLTDLDYKAQQVARELNGAPALSATLKLPALRNQLGVHEIAVFDRHGQLIAAAGEPGAGAEPPQAPSREVLERIANGQPFRATETLAGRGMVLRVALPAYPLGFNNERLTVQLSQPAPRQIAEDAELVDATRSEYRQLALSREGLKRFYRLTLALTLVVTLLGAVSLGFYLSDRLSAPLGALADGTRAVTQGDYSRQHPIYSRDELGVLTAMFNRMTKQLAEARAQTDASRAELEANNAYLESILVNLSAGVVAFDGHWRLTAANVSAERILGVGIDELAEHPLPDWPRLAPRLSPLVDATLAHADDAPGDDWQAEVAMEGERLGQTLLARGVRLPEKTGHGFVMVFDDITDLSRAQRDAAWGEVAKRLAHEIRNPLTPIQLSAERLQMKLADKLAPNDADMLARATRTIVEQVNALKGMVEAFRDYARAPKTQLARLDLANLMREVLALYESNPAVRASLPAQPLWIAGDATLLRQVLHNLLVNAQDAVLDAEQPMIHISAQQENDAVVISLEDNGPGFAAEILPRAFEPYVTSKAKGTGLGLAVVKKIIEEHHGSITVGNVTPHGARICVTLPCPEA